MQCCSEVKIGRVYKYRSWFVWILLSVSKAVLSVCVYREFDIIGVFLIILVSFSFPVNFNSLHILLLTLQMENCHYSLSILSSFPPFLWAVIKVEKK